MVEDETVYIYILISKRYRRFDISQLGEFVFSLSQSPVYVSSY